MGSRQAFVKQVNEMTPEELQKLLRGDWEMFADQVRTPATEAQARNYFAQEKPAAPVPESEIPTTPPNAGVVVGQAVSGTGQAPPEVPVEDPLEIELQKMIEAENAPLVSPEFRKKLDDYAQVFQKADLSPWAALADKWSGGGTHLSNVVKTRAAAAKTTEIDKQNLISKRQEDRQAYDLEDKYQKELTKTVEPYYKIAKLTIPQLYAALSPNPDTGKVNYLRVKQVVGQLLKLGGNVGAQSDREAARVDFDTLDKLIESAKVATGLEETAYIKPDTIVPILDFVKKAEETWNKVTADRLERTKKVYLKRGVPEDMANYLAETQLEGVTTEVAPELGKKPEPVTPVAGSAARSKAIQEAIKKAKENK